MTKNSWHLRSFKGGAWDLRKKDRRKEQVDIGFPDRRKSDRRNSLSLVKASSSLGLLDWVDRTDVDE